MKVLFVCNQNKHRSVTAQEIFSDIFETKSAGLYNGTLINKELMDWADIIYVMDETQRKEIGLRFPKQYLQKKIISLEIPDIYSYNQPELKHILKEKMLQHITLI